MAGIGFKLARVAREGGVGGIASASVQGAFVSAGPWLITAAAMLLLLRWSDKILGGTGGNVLETVLFYCFSVSAVVAAPISVLATRMVADRIFAEDPDGVPGLLVVALGAGTAISLLVGTLLFGILANLSLVQAILASFTLTWLSLIWIASPLLTTIHLYRAVPIAYLLGIATVAVILSLLPRPDATAALAATAAGVFVTSAAILFSIRQHFAGPAGWPACDAIDPRLAILVALGGLVAVTAIWIDKWLLWMAPGSAVALGALRLNPINDQGSFLGLLTMVPGLTLVLIVSETRFDRAFGDMIARCTGTSTLGRIEDARRTLTLTMVDSLRQLILMQALVAAIAWVLAVPLLEALGADPRATFVFRHTSVGVVFHLTAIATTVVLAYYDLFGRIAATWAAFAIGSAAATLLQWDSGFAAYGWGYMVGSVIGAAVGIAMVAEATVNLTYLLFVGNNPAVVGRRGRWL